MGLTVQLTPAMAAGIRGMIAEGIDWPKIEKLARMPREQIEAALGGDRLHVCMNLKVRHRQWLDELSSSTGVEVNKIVTRALLDFYQRARVEAAQEDQRRKLAAGPRN